MYKPKECAVPNVPVALLQAVEHGEFRNLFLFKTKRVDKRISALLSGTTICCKTGRIRRMGAELPSVPYSAKQFLPKKFLFWFCARCEGSVHALTLNTFSEQTTRPANQLTEKMSRTETLTQAGFVTIITKHLTLTRLIFINEMLTRQIFTRLK